jgi:hypothetical protein
MSQHKTLDMLKTQKQFHLKRLAAFREKFPQVSEEGKVLVTGTNRQEDLIQQALINFNITRKQILFRDIESGFFIRGYTFPVEGNEQIEIDFGLNIGPGRYAYMQSHGSYHEGLVYIQRYSKAGHHDLGNVQIGTRNDFVSCVYVDINTMVHEDVFQMIFDFDQLEILSY